MVRVSCFIIIQFAVFIVSWARVEVPWNNRVSNDEHESELLDIKDVVNLISDLMNHLDNIDENAEFYAESLLSFKEIWKKFNGNNRNLTESQKNALSLTLSGVETANRDDIGDRHLLEDINKQLMESLEKQRNRAPVPSRSKRSVGASSLNNFLHVASITMDDVTLNLSSLPKSKPKMNTTELMRSLWRKFLRPIYNVSKTLNQMKLLDYHVLFENCEQATNKFKSELDNQFHEISRRLERLHLHLSKMVMNNDTELVDNGYAAKMISQNNQRFLRRKSKRSTAPSIEELLSVASSVMEDDELSQPLSTSPSQPRSKPTTADLLNQIWRKFLRPINNITKSIQQLESQMKLQCELIVEQIGHKFIGIFRNVIFMLNNLQSKVMQINEKNKVLENDNVDVRATDELTGIWIASNLSSCSDIAQKAKQPLGTGIYEVQINGISTNVYCDFNSHGGGWTVIQRRGQFPNQQENFYKDWTNYKKGFGNLEREFWLGNDLIHALTDEIESTLLVELEDFEGNYVYAFYDYFKVDSEKHKYKLSISGYHGNASDSFSVHNNSLFSTKDRLMDGEELCCNCANYFEGGWWFNSCFEAYLNGPYFYQPEDNGYFKGIIWELWKGDYSLKSSEMKVRPRATDTYYDYEVEDP